MYKTTSHSNYNIYTAQKTQERLNKPIIFALLLHIEVLTAAGETLRQHSTLHHDQPMCKLRVLCVCVCETWRGVFGRGLALHKFERDLMTSTLKTCFQFVAGSDAGARVFLCAQEQPENNPFSSTALACVCRSAARDTHAVKSPRSRLAFGREVKIRRHFLRAEC